MPPAPRLSPVSDELVTFAQVLAEEAGLREWFLSMEQLTPFERAAAFTEMAARMRAAGEDELLATMISSLAEPHTYHAVRRFLSEPR